MKTCLRLGSLVIVILLSACAKPYKGLQFYKAQEKTALKYKPVFDKQLYRCLVDGHFLFKKYHLSGNLFFKTMPDKSTRVVFQNEVGFAFFDFEWNNEDSFKAIQVIPQLNKPVVIKILKKDLELFLMKGLNKQGEKMAIKDKFTYYQFRLSRGYAYYFTENDTLKRIDNRKNDSNNNKDVTTILLTGATRIKELPETVVFTHNKAHFTIQLNKIAINADE